VCRPNDSQRQIELAGFGSTGRSCGFVESVEARCRYATDSARSATTRPTSGLVVATRYGFAMHYGSALGDGSAGFGSTG
jgi:hypothetical protein